MTTMIEVKVAELSGPALDWAVAESAGEHVWLAAQVKVNGLPMVCADGAEDMHWSPSTDWSQGGPLIDKYLITLHSRTSPYGRDNGCVAHLCKTPDDGPWLHGSAEQENNIWVEGHTTLVAACRAIVKSHFGDTVSVPAELLEVAS